MQGELTQANELNFSRTVATYAIAIVAAALIGGCSAAQVKQIDNAAAEGRTEQLVETVARDMRAKVPRTYDNGIVWNSVRRKGYEIENLLTLPSDANAQGKEVEIASIVKDKMTKNLCRKANAKRLMYHGMTIRVIVKDHQGRSVTNNLISHSDC